MGVSQRGIVSSPSTTIAILQSSIYIQKVPTISSKTIVEALVALGLAANIAQFIAIAGKALPNKTLEL